MMRYACVLLWLASTISVSDALLVDPEFRFGMSVAAVKPLQVGNLKKPAVEALLQPAAAREKPAWLLAQWGSMNSLTGEASRGCNEGIACRQVIQHGHVLKQLVIGDGSDFSIRLMVDGLAEFSTRYADERVYLQKGEPWPHLLLSQPIRSRALADYASLVLSFEARLDEDNHRSREGYDAGIHAARFVIALNLKNRFTGDFLWVMLPVYDDRWPASHHGCQKCLPGEEGEPVCAVPAAMHAPGSWQCPRDVSVSVSGEAIGTSRMLFRLPSSAFVDEALQTGVWVPHRIDLKPWLLEALQAASEQGEKGFLYKPEDFRLASISLGWEVSALNRVGLSLHKLSLLADRR